MSQIQLPGTYSAIILFRFLSTTILL